MISERSALVSICDRRHLIFATDEQLLILSRAKTWYVEGTFKLCKAPFTQRGTCKTNTPGICINVREKEERLQRGGQGALLRLLPNQPSVKKITIDFERAMWSTFRKLLPEVRIMGCAFHWTQALWRKVSINLCHLEQKQPELAFC